jgi:hypothetical protein
MESSFINNYFWLLCGFWCGIIGASHIWFALRKSIKSNEFTKEEVWSFTRSYALWLFLPGLAFWILQMSSGTEVSPKFHRWPNPQKYVAYGVQFFLWGVLLYWVLIKDGAATLSRFFRATRRSKSVLYSPIVFKVLAFAVVVVGIVAFFNGQQ